MQNKGFPVAPMCASEIRKTARLWRYNIKNALSMVGKDSHKLALDMLIEGITEDVHIEIVPRNEMPNDYAQATPKQQKIRLREDVYESLCRGDARARFTLAHELGHLFLNHRVDQTFARSHQEHSHETFRDSEWQSTRALLNLPPFIRICERFRMLITRNLKQKCCLCGLIRKKGGGTNWIY